SRTQGSAGGRMNCNEMMDLLPEYIRRRLPEEESAAVRAHLATCPACAEEYDAELAFEHALRGSDAPAPAHLLPQIMASVRTQPQHTPAFRLRLLDVVFALAAAFAVYGLFIAARALWFVVPFVVETLDPRSFLSSTLGMMLVLTVIFSMIGLAI